MFVASFADSCNVDAATFLVQEVAPLLRQEIGRFKILLAGVELEGVRSLASLDVEVVGDLSVQELGSHYARHHVAVAPLRYGAGPHYMVIRALCRGLPIVTTTLASQGIAGISDVIPVCDDARGIAHALAILFTEEDAWLKQSRAELEFARRAFSTQELMNRSFLEALDAAEAAAGRAFGVARDGIESGCGSIRRHGQLVIGG